MADERAIMTTPITVLDPERERRIDALLARMTLEEKVGQMTQAERMAISPDQVREFHIGSVLSGGGSVPGDNSPEAWVEMNDAYWAASVDQGSGDRTAIPLLYGVDAIHGHNNVRGATIFPHNIGLGAAGDPDLIRRIASVTAREILATGVEWTFAPTLAVVRDIRWGRTYESYGQEPDSAAAYAGAFVEGLQSDLGDGSVMACAKHWVGDGGTTEGVDQGETTISEEELRAIHIAPYLPALEAGVLTVMASYNSWNGVKCHGHRYLLTDVLKEELGFQGFVISDWDGIDQLSDDYETAVEVSANAGVDMFMVSAKWPQLIEALKTVVADGRVPMERIDDAVRRILRAKLAYGLFDRPRPADRPYSLDTGFGSLEHREVARDAVRKSLVLLQNENQALPLDPSARILVTGRNAHNLGHQCGGFTIAWQGTSGQDAVEGGTSIWQAVEDRAPNATLDADLSRERPEEFDVALVVIGERPYAEGMGDLRSADRVSRGSAMPGQQADLAPYGDSLEASVLHPEDLEVLEKLAAAGTPAVVVFVSGRPLIVNRELELCEAFVAAWLPGSEGAGVADVLFGDAGFQGRLTFDWPRSVPQDRSRSSLEGEVRFPRGYGLGVNDA